MDEQKKYSYKLPIEWIDRIFKRLAEVYGDTFVLRFTSEATINMERLRWQSGLYGATSDEIRKVLKMCRSGFIPSPPNVIEFFHYCKGHRQPAAPKPKPYQSEASRELGQKVIKLLRDKLHGRLDSEGAATLSALSKPVLGNKDDKIKSHWQDD